MTENVANMAQQTFTNTLVSPKNLHMSPCAQHAAHALHGMEATCKTTGNKS